MQKGDDFVRKTYGFRVINLVIDVIILCVLFLILRINYDNTCNEQIPKIECSCDFLLEQSCKVKIITIEQEFTEEEIEEIEEKTKDTESNDSDKTEQQEQLFELINNYRKENGVPELIWNMSLKNAADIRAAEASVCWSHTRPDGTNFNTVDYLSFGENLARNYTTSEEIFEAWRNSESHNLNLLDGEWKSCYISFYQDTNTNVLYCSIEFSYY